MGQRQAYMRFVDMFCGAGFGARGAWQAGAKPVLAVDSSPLAAATYRDNFPHAKTLCSDVSIVDPTAHCSHNIDLLLASPECTNHSPAKGARPRCESSRETALACVSWAAALRPEWILIENVRQMANWGRYSELVASLTSIGYRGAEHLLDAADFGVAQTRKRLFVLFRLNHEPPSLDPYGSASRRPAREILDPPGMWKMSPLFSRKRALSTVQRARAAIDALGDRNPFLLVYYGSDGGGGWQSLNQPLRTVTTLDRFALVRRIDGVHYMRMLQPTELRRAMGLPDIHLMSHGTRRDRIRLCGNGVCPPIVTHIVNTIRVHSHSISRNSNKQNNTAERLAAV